MSELGHDYESLRREIAVYLGFARSGWNTAEAQDLDDVMAYGLQLYYAPAIDERKLAHRWTFLRPLGVIFTQTGVEEYLLAEDFGGMDGDLSWKDTTGSCITRVRMINESYFRALKGNYSSSGTRGGPYYAAVWPHRINGKATQRYILGITPPPDSTFRLEFRYYASQQRLSEDNSIALGMPLHADALRAAMMAAAELKMDDTKGPHWDTYRERIAVAIAIDKRNMQSDLLPLNLDRGDVAPDGCYSIHGTGSIEFTIGTVDEPEPEPEPDPGGGGEEVAAFDDGFDGGFS